jgi:hypothetical protein
LSIVAGNLATEKPTQPAGLPQFLSESPGYFGKFCPNRGLLALRGYRKPTITGFARRDIDWNLTK